MSSQQRPDGASATGTPAAAGAPAAALGALAAHMAGVAGLAAGNAAGTGAAWQPLLAQMQAVVTPGGPALSALTRLATAWSGLVACAAARGLHDAAAVVNARAAAGAPVAGLRALYDVLVDTGDASWVELAATEEFASVLGALVDAVAATSLGRAVPPWDGPLPAAPPAPAPFPALQLSAPAIAGEMAELSRQVNEALQALHAAGSVAPGATPRHPVHRFHGMTLHRMRPAGVPARGTPLLIVYALVNREHLVDLDPQRSLVRRLLAGGADVYLLEWGATPPYSREVNLAHYVERGIGEAVGWLRAHRRRRAVDLLGVCQGGTLSLCYAALHPAMVRNLACLVTPVDFHVPGFLLSHWLRHVNVDLLVEAYGNVPGAWLNWLFLSLRPLQLGSRKYLDMLPRLAHPGEAAAFLRMEQWLHDSPDQAGEAFRDFARGCCAENGLVCGGLRIAGRRVDLRAVRGPVFNAAAARDHIVPPASTRALRGLTGSHDYREHVLDTGHAGMFAGRRTGEALGALLCGWLRERRGTRARVPA